MYGIASSPTPSSTTRFVTPNAVSVVICTPPRCRDGNPSWRNSAVRSRGGSSPVFLPPVSDHGSRTWWAGKSTHPGYPGRPCESMSRATDTDADAHPEQKPREPFSVRRLERTRRTRIQQTHALSGDAVGLDELAHRHAVHRCLCLCLCLRRGGGPGGGKASLQRPSCVGREMCEPYRRRWSRQREHVLARELSSPIRSSSSSQIHARDIRARPRVADTPASTRLLPCVLSIVD